MRRVGAAILWLWIAVPGVACSQEVTLEARDGALSISGRILGYDGTFYRLETEFGEVSVDGTRVTCTGAACPDIDAFVPELRISGSAAVGDILLPVLLETFAVRRGLSLTRVDSADDTTFEIREEADGAILSRVTLTLSTSDEGFADLIADEADLIVSRREITTDEALFARQAGRGDLTNAGRSRILALDAIVPAVAVGNRVGTISIDALRAVVSGEIVDWTDLGGDPGSIRLHVTDPGSGLLQAFLRLAMQRGEVALPGGTVVHEDDATLAMAVAEDPAALGLAAFSRLGNVQPLIVAGQCGKRVEADFLTLKSEDYPLTAPIFLYAPMRRLSGLARDFVEYVTSPAAQPVIRRAGFVDQFPEAIPLEAQGRRLAYAISSAGEQVSLQDLQRLVEAMDGKVRLSLSFRFEGGSTELDAQSRANVELLAEALERGVFDDRSLTFAGFSDGAGDALTNLSLSRDRAGVVRDAVRAAIDDLDRDLVSLETAAFGEAMPMACDRTDWGARVNRRVEVWLD
ncbi:phosphate ABC transporter substrate-binding/OmpA family protein [Palleronia sp. LCG004]|uniref:phosphate ABC transporter substrate-binding/OmpA family protein n=1 Tax=Palleronia sp. LCG004 TaxID=3079304 RepID=UPI0029421AE6|nr:phosphate ABC transporter substrate-binding/OmpA family protein [Palleronia sp. LCG004]WOI55986.1 phosphate ABC transporter substrate-binding/OmpA family protein [Palleronia sp. LCG004]